MQQFFVEGRDYLGFDSLDEAERQVKLLLSDDEKRKEISQNGYNAVLSHTWDARVQMLLETVGLV
jgi:spore maturation protein CgeB